MKKKEKISSIIPRLEKIQGLKPTIHKIQKFEGREGMKTIFNDLTSKPNETVKIIGFVNKWLEFSEIFTDIYYRKKKENKIQTLVIVDKKEKEDAKNKKIVNSAIRFLDDLDLDSECFIYHDKVALVSFEENNLNGVIIQNKEIFNLQNNLFDKLWKQAKK